MLENMHEAEVVAESLRSGCELVFLWVQKKTGTGQKSGPVLAVKSWILQKGGPVLAVKSWILKKGGPVLVVKICGPEKRLSGSG